MNKSVIKQICKKRSTLPILSCVKVSRKSGVLNVQCTDLEISYNDTVTSEGDDFNAVLVNGAQFADCLTNTMSDLIRLTDDGLHVNGIVLKSEDDVSCYPLLPQSTQLLGSLEDLDLILSRVNYAASSDPTRYHLNGVYLDKGRAVATDGHRLALTNTPDGWNVAAKLNIHSEAVEVIQKLAIENAEIHKTSTTETYMLKHGALELSFRSLPNNYPNVDQFLPKKYNKTVILNTNTTLDALKRMKPILKGQKNKGVKITINNDEFKIERDGTVLTASCASKFDDPIEFGVNAEYLTEALSKFKNTSCKFYFNDKISAFKISNGTADAIIMPLRV